MSAITSALAALATALAPVATVRTGQAALETTSATLPVITLLSLNDALAAEQDYAVRTYTRRAVLEYKRKATATYPAALDTALAAIRSVLVPAATGLWLGGHALALRETAVTFFHPEPNGTDTVLHVFIDIDYSE